VGPAPEKVELKPSGKVAAVSNFVEWLQEWTRIKNWINRRALLLRLYESE
jgi:hypothetical protein